MELVRPSEKYVPSYAEAIAEDELYRKGGERRFRDPETVVERARNFEYGIDLPKGFVPETILWLVEGDRFIGEIGIRHRLTPALEKFGGNIGYEIRWSESGKGYGTGMLAMALPCCAQIPGLNKVLLTCDDANTASIRIIEKNGGVLQDKVLNYLDRGQVLTRRYWIDLIRERPQP